MWVDEHGAWGNGPLTGRGHSDVARHIGAQARAAARAARLTEIETAIAELDDDDGRRVQQRQAIGEQT